MKTVVYSCPFIPCEWIAAHGLRPWRISPQATATATTGPTTGVCSYVRAFVDSACQDDPASGSRPVAVITTTLCDQMRRAHDLIARNFDGAAFLMNVPSTWGSPESQRLYIDELKRLGRFLRNLSGQSPSAARLAGVMLEHDNLRSWLRAARLRVPAKEHSRLLLEIASGQRPSIDEDRPAPSPIGIPVALLGGPLRREDFDIFDLVEAAGGQVVLDACDSGERTLPAPFDRRRLRQWAEDADGDGASCQPLLAELADAYFGNIPHPFRRPNSRLYRYLEKEPPARGARAIILRRYQWCDIWNGETQRLKDWLNVPVLELHIGGAGQDRPRQAGRIRALMETLS